MTAASTDTYTYTWTAGTNRIANIATASGTRTLSHDARGNLSGESRPVASASLLLMTAMAAEGDSATNNPVDQLKRQISDIRNKGGIKSSAGREIAVPPKTMVRGYILADWNDSLQNHPQMEDFVITNYGGQMAYRYFQSLNLMLEVVAFDRLVDRATNRNEAFVQMLEGRSNYDRKPKGTLGSLGAPAEVVLTVCYAPWDFTWRLCCSFTSCCSAHSGLGWLSALDR